MGLFGNILRDYAQRTASSQELYIIYSTATITDQCVDFASTADLVAFTSYNTDLVTAKVVRKNTSETDVSLEDAFRGCVNLTSIDFSEFDVDDVVNMTYMLRACSSLTSLDLSNFRTSNVTSFYGMLQGCDSLVSVDLSNVDTSSSTNARYMFLYCSSLEELYWATNKDSLQAIASYSYMGEYGNTIYVADSLVGDYKTATYFSAWASQIKSANEELYLIYNTATLTNQRRDFTSTSAMKSFIQSSYSSFTGAMTAVRQNIYDDFTDYSCFFYGSSSLSSNHRLNITSLDLSNFDTTGAITMEAMFFGLWNLSYLDVTGINSSSVINMSRMFGQLGTTITILSLDLSHLDTSKVIDMSEMLQEAYIETLNLSNLDTSSATNATNMLNYMYLKNLYWATNKDTFQSLPSGTDIGAFNAWEEGATTIYVPTALVDEYKSADYFKWNVDGIVGI